MNPIQSSCIMAVPKSGVGIPAPLLQKVVADQNASLTRAREQLADDGKILIQMIDGSLATYGATTSSSKEVIKIDASEDNDAYTFY